MRQPKRYGFWKFILDVILVSLTGGLWIIWIFVREMRNRSAQQQYVPYDPNYNRRRR